MAFKVSYTSFCSSSSCRAGTLCSLWDYSLLPQDMREVVYLIIKISSSLQTRSCCFWQMFSPNYRLENRDTRPCGILFLSGLYKLVDPTLGCSGHAGLPDVDTEYRHSLRLVSVKFKWAPNWEMGKCLSHLFTLSTSWNLCYVSNSFYIWNLSRLWACSAFILKTD